MTPEQATATTGEKMHGALLLALFLGLGVWQILLIPFFQGPDEQVHYATVQYWAELDEKTWLIKESSELTQGNDIRTWHFSEEIREAAARMQFDEIKWQATNTQSFSVGTRWGKDEETIENNDWSRRIDTHPVNASGTWSLYYLVGSKIETVLADQPIFTRLFFARLFSLSLGGLVVLLAYLSARKLRWPTTTAIAFASLIAFQPMLLATSAIVNIDILLVFAFSLFFYGVITWLTDGVSIRATRILLAATLVGIFTKGPGIVLLAPLLFLGADWLYRRLGWPWQDFLPRSLLAAFVVLSLTFIFTPPAILAGFLHLGTDSVFASSLESLSAYAEKTLTAGALLWTATTYWGSFGWLDTSLPEAIIHFILTIEAIACFGLLWLFFDKQLPHFLPEKRILFFAVLAIILMQFAIRFFDWRYFDTTGQIVIGTPGRYFLPNILPHFLLLVSGLGYFLPTRLAFDRLLAILSALLFLLTIYTTWAIILPRYYL